MKNRGILFENENSKEKRLKNEERSIVDSVKDKNKIVTLAKASDAILFKAKTVFPFTFFVDDIVIDKTKVTIIERLFFFHQDITSFAIEDILNVSVSSSVFFSTLTCLTRYEEKVVFSLQYLKKSDATFAKKLIQGLVIAKREGVHIEELSKDAIMEYGETIGQGDRKE